MGDRGEPGEGAIEELAGGPPVRVGDEPDPAGVAFAGGIVECGGHGGCSSLSSVGSERGGSRRMWR